MQGITFRVDCLRSGYDMNAFPTISKKSNKVIFGGPLNLFSIQCRLPLAMARRWQAVENTIFPSGFCGKRHNKIATSCRRRQRPNFSQISTVSSPCTGFKEECQVKMQDQVTVVNSLFSVYSFSVEYFCKLLKRVPVVIGIPYVSRSINQMMTLGFLGQVVIQIAPSWHHYVCSLQKRYCYLIGLRS